MAQYDVRPVEPGDREQWQALYRGYGDFYAEPQADTTLDLVWSWLMDPDHEVSGLLAIDGQGTALGLAHYRPFARPLAGSVGCYLDDLFVAPQARGTGAADALLVALRALAKERGWSVVRWITADHNHRARAKYDQVATRTMWVTYDMDPDIKPSQPRL